MNTRTYHRNSVLAFPRTAEYGAAIERPAPLFARTRLASAAVGWATVLACAALVVVMLVE